MRALPALSLEYFGETALGNTAFPAGADVVEGCAAVGLAGAAAGAFALGVGAAAGAAAGVAAASEPHCAFLKSCHFWPLRVPAVCAALYLALHSFIVRAWADVPHKQSAARMARERAIMSGS